MKIQVPHDAKILFVDDYPNHFLLKHELIEDLISSKDMQNKLTNVKATMTDWNITSHQIELLKTFAINKIYENNLVWHYADLEFNTFWANIYRQKEFTISHDHLPDLFSFVYFLNAESNFAPLIFNFSNTKIIPKEGSMVIFPSYLAHSVPEHESDQIRITLSGNISLK